MRIRRRLPVIVAVALVAGAVALAVVLRKHAPPEPARLLPGADGFAYINLQWMRRANVLGELPSVPHDAEYEQFIQQTGFEFERDLDQAAFAIHYNRAGKQLSPRFSEIFAGRIDGQRLASYLRKISASIETYRDIEIYSIAIEDRTLRVAVIGVGTVAASNHDDPLVIRGIIDRSHKLASPFGGPALLRQYYKYVPFTSLFWGIVKLDSSVEASLPDQSLVSSTLLSWMKEKPAVIVASVRYFGSVHLKAEAFTGSDDAARHLTEQLSTLLSIFRAAEVSVSQPGGDADTQHFLDSLRVVQNKDRAELTALVPTALLRKIVAEVPPGVNPEMPASQSGSRAPVQP